MLPRSGGSSSTCSLFGTRIVLLYSTVRTRQYGKLNRVASFDFAEVNTGIRAKSERRQANAFVRFYHLYH